MFAMTITPEMLIKKVPMMARPDTIRQAIQRTRDHIVYLKQWGATTELNQSGDHVSQGALLAPEMRCLEKLRKALEEA